MYKNILSTFLIMVLSGLFITGLMGQTIVLNKKAIDKNRYKGISGSPYYFEEPVQANLYLANSDKPFLTLLNINLHENELEVYEGNEYAVIANNEIDHIEVISDEKNNALRSTWNGKSYQMNHFEGDNYSFNEIPRVIIDVREHRPPGEIIIKKKFVKKSNFSITLSGSTAGIDISKKSVAKVLGKEAEKIAKNQKNKLKKLEDLVRLLDELDQ